MSTITKERLEPVIERFEHYATNVKWTNVQAAQDMLIAVDAMRRLLASLEAEPVCVIDQSNLDYLNSGSDADVWPASRTEMGDVLLYRSSPPAPVSVPDERAAFNAWNNDTDCPLAGLDSKKAAWLAWSRRAAMLQGADGNSPVIAKAYDIEAFGVFSATEGEDGLLLQIENFRLGTENCPQIGKGNMVPKFALQAIINRLQAHCNSMGEDTLIDIFASSAAPQQEDK